MKFLIDECLSTRLADLLVAEGHPAHHVCDVGLTGEPDPVVIATAATEGAVLLTGDTDFGTILATSEIECSVIIFRCSLMGASTLARLLTDNLEEFHEDLAAGALVIIDDNRVRVRRLPLR
ncbi:DUF5615 family PIN-like protein [Gordonia sp. (in: high G+C Gram-positive bacteria)]|jgi:predicted nuclease of predicted toxin-antitoxin system|uniref:DUF5615 family PIN-like protein n=1 Tax=Gordonia sp. (in: high G+C Gram-positive bacteria) TaxID=84139 RepID=UPI002FDAF7A3